MVYLNDDACCVLAYSISSNNSYTRPPYRIANNIILLNTLQYARWFAVSLHSYNIMNYDNCRNDKKNN